MKRSRTQRPQPRSIRLLSWLVASTILSAGSSALAQSSCGASNGNGCCTASSTPGCSNTTCCTAICAADPFCCNTAWDQICANAANSQCAVCLVVTVANNGCAGTTVTFPPIAGAASYEIVREVQTTCNVCGFPAVATMETLPPPPAPFTVISPGSITMSATPSFFGRWKVTARNAAGAAIIDLFSPSAVAHPATGLPYTSFTNESVSIDVGMSVTLKATPFQTNVTSYQWYRGAVPIPGATAPTYVATVLPSDPATVMYSCVLGNTCGGILSNFFEVVKSSCAPPMPVKLLTHTERQEYSVLVPVPFNVNCGYDFAPTVRDGTCEATFTTFGANAISVAMSVPDSNNARRTHSTVTSFQVFGDTNLSVNLTGTSGGFLTTGTVSLAGPVAYTATGTVNSPVNRTDLLTPGVYTLTVVIETGNLGCRNCSGCGPSCQQSCQLLALGRSLAMNATFEPLSPCGNPSAGNCCVPTGGPGCSDAACCESVCAVDPFCCNTQWDSICVSGARALCKICAVTGDLNNDGIVDATDLALLLGAWGTPAGDIDGDGTTNASDLALLLGNWG